MAFDFQVGEDGGSKCLSGCEDQINSVSVTSSSFPNEGTLVRREEFCLAVLKLVKTCNSAKRVLLEVRILSILHRDGLHDWMGKNFWPDGLWGFDITGGGDRNRMT